MRAALLSALLLLSVLPAPAGPPGTREAEALWAAWPEARVSPADPWALRHGDLRRALADLQRRHPGLVEVVDEGASALGRPIPLLRVGRGPLPVLLWSQMHGDEPSATSALLDLLNWLGAGRGAGTGADRMLAGLTLWIIPMLNPDGAELAQRRNAQELDINRDALRLASPEGRFLKAARERARPLLGFNLHNQNPNLRSGKAGAQAALSLLAVPGDAADSLTPGTRRTRQMALAARRLAEAVAPGRVARYDTDYTERAFGDSMTRWGTATLLIETGGWSGPGEAARLVRLNFLVLAGVLQGLADGTLDDLDPADYGSIPLNARDAVASLVLRGVRLAGGRGLPPFPADLAFQVPGPFGGDQPRRRGPALEDLGDLTHVLGLEEADGTGLLAVPWPDGRDDWPALRDALRAQGLARAPESALLAAAKAQGEAAVAKRGFSGAVLLYRPAGDGTLALEGAILRGRRVGDGTP